ncbi:MAG: theronine dehydrogenase [Deltaproteobacteria bacterium]|nr:MAG: theronine dehydrogenase [Deltaproteobacteria bacterium]
MATEMNALVYDRAKDVWEQSKGLRRERVPEPVLDERADYRDAHMALIRPRFAGFCGSDRGIWFRRAFKDMIYESLDADGKDVRIIGHELFGEIVAVGSQARRELGLKVGDTVSAESHIICGTCYQCIIGDNHVCEDNKIIGISTDGCFADLVKLPAQMLWPVDVHTVRPEVAALLEPFGNAVHACTKVNLRGKRVAILGCGTIGLFAVAVARALGANVVIGVEPLPSHIEMARKLGADEVLVPAHREGTVYEHDPDLAERIKKLTDGVGVDVALEMSGQNASVNNAIASVRRGGAVILFGLKSGDAVIEDLDRVIVDGISLHSVVGRRIWETWHVGRGLLESRHSDLQDKIWDIILNRGDGTVTPFSEFEADAFEQKITKYPKVLFRFD